MSDDNGIWSDSGSAPARAWWTSVLDLLTSLKFALSVLFVIAVACAAGTLFPQGSAVAGFLHKHPDAKGKMAVLDAIGLTHVYSSWWFVTLLCILGASLSVCALRRFLTTLRKGGRIRGRAIGSLLTHMSMLLVLIGGVVRITVGQRGMISFHEGQRADSFITEEGTIVPLPFRVELVKFQIETYGQDTSRARTSSEQLTVTRADQHLETPKPPRVKDYKSTLRLLEGDTVVKEKTIEVNLPLSHRGYKLYQSGYNPHDPTWTALQVVRDPGVPLVYAGFALMIIGLAIVFYVYPGVKAPTGAGRGKEEISS